MYNFFIHKVTLLVLLILVYTFQLNSQTSIKGSIQDSTHTPIPFCALALLNASDSSIYKGNLTNENGEFSFEGINNSSYIIKISHVGFLNFKSELIKVDSLHQQQQLQPFVLKNNAINLNEVAVSIFKPTVEFKKGTTILNVENNLIANGNTVLELLKRIPGITIDNQNNIFINGKSGARFLINGRLQYLTGAQMINVLSSMNAESVATIELIKNPPAKYDAAGTAGLINIVLKKGKLKGFNGSLYNLIGQGYYFRNTSILNLNFKSNKWSLFSNLTYMNLNLIDNFKFYRTIQSSVEDKINEDGLDLMHKLILTGNLGIEYDLNKNNSLGFNINGGPNKNSHQMESKISIPSGTIFPYNYIKSKSPFSEDFNNPSINFNGQHKFDTLGTQIQFSADYTNFIGLEKKLNENRFYNIANQEILPLYSNKSETKRDFKIFTQKIDFTKNFNKDWTLEIGAKGGFANNKNIFSLYLNNDTNGQLELDTQFSNTYDYKEQILAGYTTINKTFKKINIQAGVRAEQTDINAINKTNGFKITRHYLNIFPSGALDYTINNKNSLQAQYSYRIDRPDYMALNPVKVFWDKLDYRAGNPFLLPQYSHNINIDFNHGGNFVNSINFIQTKQSFYSYSYSNQNTKINTDTLVNFGTRNNLAYTLFIQKQIKWYNFQLNGIALYRNFVGQLNGENANSETFFYSFSLNNEFNLPHDFKLQAFAVYNSPIRESLQLYRHSSTVNFVVQKSLFDKKLFISIGFHDIFYQEITGITTQFANQSTYFYMKNDSRRIRFTLNYKFGKTKFQQKTIRSNEDESNRLKSSGK